MVPMPYDFDILKNLRKFSVVIYSNNTSKYLEFVYQRCHGKMITLNFLIPSDLGFEFTKWAQYYLMNA